MGRGSGDIGTQGASTRSEAEPVIVDDDGKRLEVGSLVVDLTRTEYKGPAPKVTAIGEPQEGMVIVKLGEQNSEPGQWSSMLFALQGADGRYKANLRLLEV